MNKTQVSKRMRELTIQIADLQTEFRSLIAEKVRLDLIKPVKRKRRKRRKTTRKVRKA